VLSHEAPEMAHMPRAPSEDHSSPGENGESGEGQGKNRVLSVPLPLFSETQGNSSGRDAQGIPLFEVLRRFSPDVTLLPVHGISEGEAQEEAWHLRQTHLLAYEAVSGGNGFGGRIDGGQRKYPRAHSIVQK